MTIRLIYDDVAPVPAESASLTGIGRYGRLLHQRRRLQDLVVETVSSEFEDVLTIRSPEARRDLIRRLGDERDARWVYMTSDIVARDFDTLRLFLAKLSYSSRDLLGQPPGSGPLTAVGVFSSGALMALLEQDSPAARHKYLADADGLAELPAADLVSLHDLSHFIPFLSGTFYTRSFNQIRTEPRTVIKTSDDVGKMKREHDFWYLLPPELQRFVVQPYGYETSADGASYKMERYIVPDMAILWVQDALSEGEFATFLDGVFDWVSAVPRRDEDRHQALYVDKVRARLKRLSALPVGAQLDAMLASGTRFDSLADVVEDYFKLLETVPARHRSAILHGDLCFSNILYDKRTGLLKFIDPRGAVESDQLWGDATYDIAKLSHSVLGSYDFINYELFDVIVGDDLQFHLRTETPPRPSARQLFLDRVESAGFSPRRIRLYEASLFLSMLPLHSESPRKLLAFALTAIDILDEVRAW